MDSILFSADPKKVTMADAIRHLRREKNLYWSVGFPIDRKQFSFPMVGFIHIKGDRVRYRALISGIRPFKPDDYRNAKVKPKQWRDDWAHNPVTRRYPWKYQLVISAIAQFSSDIRWFQKKGGGSVTHPPRNYVRVRPPKPLLILNVAWMKRYRGRAPDDEPHGDFGYMKGGNIPHEIFNFLPYKGDCYGYAPAFSLDIQKLGAGDSTSFADDVLVVWTATHPDGGRYVIGWYDGAIVYPQERYRPETSATKRSLKSPLFLIRAPSKVCRLLPEDERVFPVPAMQDNYPGLHAQFYADITAPPKWVAELRCYLATGEVATSLPTTSDDYPPVDAEFKKLVETGAIETVKRHYEERGFKVISREADNVGWDLEARLGGAIHRLEVKGLSGTGMQVEMTHNEYVAMRSKKHRNSYRVCVVNEAHKLKSAKLRIFRYDLNMDKWVNEEGNCLLIIERTAATLAMQL